MDSISYKDKYKALKRKFKALQNVSDMQEHLKLSSQFDLFGKTIRLCKREISFMDEKINEVQKKSAKPYKKIKIEDADDSLIQIINSRFVAQQGIL